MSGALNLPLSPSDAPRRMQFTRADADRLSAAGVFDGRRFELIDGDLYDKSGQNPPHAAVIRRLSRLLPRVFPDLPVQAQLPIEVSSADRDRSLPEPDFALLRETNPEFDRRHPRGDEALLLIEVADSSLALDLSRKVTPYARAGVPEYWVVDLTRRMVVVHRRADGATYRLAELFAAEDTLTLEGRNEPIRVADILPENE
jgi:Uma2 family endonuclease